MNLPDAVNESRSTEWLGSKPSYPNVLWTQLCKFSFLELSVRVRSIMLQAG